jgi:hypothetical protein
VLELRKVNESVSIMICANYRTLLLSLGNLKKCSILIFSTVKRAICWKVNGRTAIDWRGLVLEDHWTTFPRCVHSPSTAEFQYCKECAIC